MTRILLVLLCTSLAFAFADAPAQAQSDDDLDAVVPDTSWTSYASQDGHYTVDFPGVPVDTSMVTASPAGPMTAYSRIYEFGESALISAYMPMSAALDSVKADSMLNLIAENLGSRIGVAQTTYEPTTLNGYPGRIVTQAGSSDAVLEWRTFLVGSYLYQIAYLGQQEQPDVTERFFDSFAFTMPADSIAALSPERPALEQRLETLGWNYDVEDESRYEMILQIDSTRSQLVYAEEVTDPVSENTRFQIWAPVGFFEEAPSPELLLDLLSQNGEVELGAFRSYTTDDGYYVAFVAHVDAVIDAETLEGVFFFAGETADTAEAEWVGGDEY